MPTTPRDFQQGPEPMPRNRLADWAREYGLYGLSNRLNDPTSGAGMVVDAIGGLGNALIVQPAQSFNRLLTNGYESGNPQSAEDAFNVAGAAMVGGLAAPRPRGSVGMGGRPGAAINAAGERQGFKAYRGQADNKALGKNDGTVWASSSPELADVYAMTNSAKNTAEDWTANLKPNITPVEMKFANPLTVGRLGSKYTATWDQLSHDGMTFTTDQLADYARRQGHDGLIVRNVIDGSRSIPQTSYAALERGTVYSPLTGDLLYASGGRPGAATGAALNAAGERSGGTSAQAGRLPANSPGPNPQQSGLMATDQTVPVLSRPPHLQGQAPHTTIADGQLTGAYRDPFGLAGVPSSLHDDAAVAHFVNGFKSIEEGPFTKWPDAYGLRRMNASDEIKPGDWLTESRVWVDGEPTNQLLDGTSAISLLQFPPTEDAIRKAWNVLKRYEGDRVVPIGGKQSSSAGVDPGEVVVRDAQALFANGGRPGAVVGAAANATAERQGIRAYHGSPHDFDRFDMSKIGTGEGAQAYGHGLYFAENEGVAKSYREGLTKWKAELDGKPIMDLWAEGKLPEALSKAAGLNRVDSIGAANIVSESVRTGRPVRDVVADRIQRARDAYPAELAESEIAKLSEISAKVDPLMDGLSSGRLYEVRINADPEDFLDWDKPLSQQSEKVRGAFPSEMLGMRGSEAIDKLGSRLAPVQQKLSDDYVAYINSVNPSWGAGLKKIQDTKSSREASSTALREAGIPGIKYLDQGSRTAGEGSRNYVVFDDKLIEILRKYGLLGMIGGGAVAAGSEADRKQPQDWARKMQPGDA